MHKLSLNGIWQVASEKPAHSGYTRLTCPYFRAGALACLADLSRRNLMKTEVFSTKADPWAKYPACCRIKAFPPHCGVVDVALCSSLSKVSGLLPDKGLFT